MKITAISLEKAAYVIFYSIHKFLFVISQEVEALLEEVIAKLHSLSARNPLCVT